MDNLGFTPKVYNTNSTTNSNKLYKEIVKVMLQINKKYKDKKDNTNEVIEF